jgi:Uma2 family endonuclease
MTDMTTITLQLPQSLTAGEIVAVGVSEDEYMETYAETHHEWVRGVVIKMSPVRLVHDEIVTYLRDLLRAYLSAVGVSGRVVSDPFVMRLAQSRRQPDLQVILGENQNNLQDTYMDGPADICVEVVSPGSVGIDYGEKLEEYEAGGVREYWIIDPQRRRGSFNRLNDETLYADVSPKADAVYTTPLLPQLQLHVPTLWQDDLPDYGEVWQAVQVMLKKA